MILLCTSRYPTPGFHCLFVFYVKTGPQTFAITSSSHFYLFTPFTLVTFSITGFWKISCLILGCLWVKSVHVWCFIIAMWAHVTHCRTKTGISIIYLFFLLPCAVWNSCDKFKILPCEPGLRLTVCSLPQLFLIPLLPHLHPLTFSTVLYKHINSVVFIVPAGVYSPALLWTYLVSLSSVHVS